MCLVPKARHPFVPPARLRLRDDHRLVSLAATPLTLSIRSLRARSLLSSSTAGAPHLLVFPKQASEPMMWLLGKDPADAADWVLATLAEALGFRCHAPRGVAVSSWADDPYSAGAYSHIPPGASPADADLLGEPVAGRLLFAGEHTQASRLVYTDGAMASGIREAKRLLSAASVQLTTS